MRALMAGALAAALTGCAPSVGETALDGLNLADGATLASLQAALPQDDRAALGTYALLHWPKSKFYCGEAIGGRNAVAATVGEAIAQTRAYEKRLELAQAQARATASLAAREEETALVTRMEQLVYERDILYAQVGPAAAGSPRDKDISRRLAALRSELEAVRSLPAG